MRYNFLALCWRPKFLALILVMATGEVSAETPEEATNRIKRMEQIADFALVPPTLNTSPLPEYAYDKLDCSVVCQFTMPSPLE